MHGVTVSAGENEVHRPRRGPRTPEGDPDDSPSSSSSPEINEHVRRPRRGPRTPPMPPPEEQPAGYYAEFGYAPYPSHTYHPQYLAQYPSHYPSHGLSSTEGGLPPPPVPPGQAPYYYYPTPTSTGYYPQPQYPPAPSTAPAPIMLSPPPKPPRLDTAVPPPPPKPAEMMAASGIRTKVWGRKEAATEAAAVPLLPPVSVLSRNPIPKTSPHAISRPARASSADSEDGSYAQPKHRTPTGHSSMIAPADILSEAHQTTVNRPHRKKENGKHTSPNSGSMFEPLPPPPNPPAPLRAASPPKNQNASFTDVLTPKTPRTPALNGSNRFYSTEKSPEPGSRNVPEPHKVEKEVPFDRAEEQREPAKEIGIQEKSSPQESEIRRELPIEKDLNNVEEEKQEDGISKQPVEQIRALPFEFFTPTQSKPLVSTAPVSGKPFVQPIFVAPVTPQPAPGRNKDPKRDTSKAASIDSTQRSSFVVSTSSLSTSQTPKAAKPLSKVPPTVPPMTGPQEERKQDGQSEPHDAKDDDKSGNLKSRMFNFKQLKSMQARKKHAAAAGMIPADGIMEIDALNSSEQLIVDQQEDEHSGDDCEKDELSTSGDLKQQDDTRNEKAHNSPSSSKNTVNENMSGEHKTKGLHDSHRKQKNVFSLDKKPKERPYTGSEPKKQPNEQKIRDEGSDAHKKNKKAEQAAELQLSTEMQEVSLKARSEEPADDVSVVAMAMQPEPCKEVVQKTNIYESLVPVKETPNEVPKTEKPVESLKASLGEESQHSTPGEEAQVQKIVEDQNQHLDGGLLHDDDPMDTSPVESSSAKMSTPVPDTETVEHTPQSSPMEDSSPAGSPMGQPASATSPTEEATPSASPANASIMAGEPVPESVSTADKEINGAPESYLCQEGNSSKHVEKQSLRETSQLSQEAVAADHELATEEESFASSALDATINAVASASSQFTIPTAPPNRKKRLEVPEVPINKSNGIKAPSAVKQSEERPASQSAPSAGRGRKRTNQPAVMKPTVVTKAALKLVPPPPKKTQKVANRRRYRMDESDSPSSVSRSPTPDSPDFILSPSIDDKRRIKSPLTPCNNIREPLDSNKLRRELDMAIRRSHNLNSEREFKVENQPKPSMFFDPNFKPAKLGRPSVASSTCTALSSRAGSSERSTPHTAIRFSLSAAKKQKDDAEDEMIKNQQNPVGEGGEVSLEGVLYPPLSLKPVKTEFPDPEIDFPTTKLMDYRQRSNVLTEMVRLQGSKIMGQAVSAVKRVKQEEEELKASKSFSRVKRIAESISPELKLSMRTLKKLTKQYDLPRVSSRFRHYLRVRTHPNGGGHTLSCDYLQFRDKLTRSEIDTFCRQFIRLGMTETGGHPVFCIAIMENGADGMPNCFGKLIKTHPGLEIKYGNIKNLQEIITKPLRSYYKSCLKHYKSGTFRYGPMHAVTLTGRKAEEVGGLYNEILDTLDEHPFLAPVMPWGEFTEMRGTARAASNDGPILWVRPGEQTVPSTGMKEETIILSKRGAIRETEFLDRTLCHADIAGDDDTKSAWRTGAIGVLQCIPGTDVEALCPDDRPAVKEVVAFTSDCMDLVFSALNMDFYNFPTHQCKTYVDDGKLNSMRRLGARYSKFELRVNDMYFIPRNIVHQFRTTRACVSLAWHTRLLHQTASRKLRFVPDPAHECHSDYSDFDEPPVKKIQKILS